MQLFDQLRLMAVKSDQDSNYNIMEERVEDVETAFDNKMNKY